MSVPGSWNALLSLRDMIDTTIFSILAKSAADISLSHSAHNNKHKTITMCTHRSLNFWTQKFIPYSGPEIESEVVRAATINGDVVANSHDMAHS